jgi:hypothetical protein
MRKRNIFVTMNVTLVILQVWRGGGINASQETIEEATTSASSKAPNYDEEAQDYFSQAFD